MNPKNLRTRLRASWIPSSVSAAKSVAETDDPIPRPRGRRAGRPRGQTRPPGEVGARRRCVSAQVRDEKVDGRVVRVVAAGRECDEVLLARDPLVARHDGTEGEDTPHRQGGEDAAAPSHRRRDAVALERLDERGSRQAPVRLEHRSEDALAAIERLRGDAVRPRLPVARHREDEVHGARFDDVEGSALRPRAHEMPVVEGSVDVGDGRVAGGTDADGPAAGREILGLHGEQAPGDVGNGRDRLGEQVRLKAPAPDVCGIHRYVSRSRTAGRRRTA
nr:hypothetical protein [Microbacterium oleivorans]